MEILLLFFAVYSLAAVPAYFVLWLVAAIWNRLGWKPLPPWAKKGIYCLIFTPILIKFAHGGVVSPFFYFLCASLLHAREISLSSIRKSTSLDYTLLLMAGIWVFAMILQKFWKRSSSSAPDPQ